VTYGRLRPNSSSFLAFYSSHLGGITRDPGLARFVGLGLRQIPHREGFVAAIVVIRKKDA